jgi:hypothetical protein
LRHATMEIKKIAVDYDEFISRNSSAMSKIWANIQLRFFLFDKWEIYATKCLIAGKNHWLNTVLLWRLSFRYKQITVFYTGECDGGNYGEIETNRFLSDVSKLFPGHNASSIDGMLVSLRNDASSRSKIVNLNSDGMRAKQIWSADGRLGIKLFRDKFCEMKKNKKQLADGGEATRSGMEEINNEHRRVDWEAGYTRMVICENLFLTSAIGGYSTKFVDGICEPAFDNIKVFGYSQKIAAPSYECQISETKKIFLL